MEPGKHLHPNKTRKGKKSNKTSTPNVLKLSENHRMGRVGMIKKIFPGSLRLRSEWETWCVIEGSLIKGNRRKK